MGAMGKPGCHNEKDRAFADGASAGAALAALLLAAVLAGCGGAEKERTEENPGISGWVKERIAASGRIARKAVGEVAETKRRIDGVLDDARRTEEEEYARWRFRRHHPGSLEDTYADEEAFWAVGGGRDYERAPVARPVDLCKIASTIDLCRNATVIVRDVSAIGRDGDWVFGAMAPFRPDSGGTATHFAHRVSADETRFFPLREALDGFLSVEGVRATALYPAQVLLDEFRLHGVLPFPPWGAGTRTHLVVVCDENAVDPIGNGEP